MTDNKAIIRSLETYLLILETSKLREITQSELMTLKKEIEQTEELIRLLKLEQNLKSDSYMSQLVKNLKFSTDAFDGVKK